MSFWPQQNVPEKVVGRQASAWVVRIERGLTAAEQDEFSEWLSADWRHRQAIGELTAYWKRLDTLGALASRA